GGDRAEQHGRVDAGTDAAPEPHPVPPAKAQLAEGPQPILSVLRDDFRRRAAEPARERPLCLLIAYLVAARLRVDRYNETRRARDALTCRVAWQRCEHHRDRQCHTEEEGRARTRTRDHGAIVPDQPAWK